MMNTDEYRVNTRNKVKREAKNRKEEAKVKSILKEQTRREREPSCRLGKNEKKQVARTSKILECELTLEGDNLVDSQDPIIGVKQLRIRLARPRRKPGHRDPNATRVEQTDHLEGLDPPILNDIHYDDGFNWGRDMTEISDEAHKKRRQIERLANERAILENERLLTQEASYWRAASTNFIGRGDLD